MNIDVDNNKFQSFLEQLFKNIEDERHKKGLSYQELAYRSNLDKSNVVSIISNKKNITLKTLHKICEGLDICICDIIKDGV